MIEKLFDQIYFFAKYLGVNRSSKILKWKFLVKFKFNPGFLTSRETFARNFRETAEYFFIDVHSDDPNKFISEDEFFFSIKN